MNDKSLNMYYFAASNAMRKGVLSLLLLLPIIGFSQSYGEFGLFLGGSYYLGDLNPGKHFQSPSPAFGGFLRHNFNERIAIKAAGTYGTIKGDDAVSGYNPNRNLNFSSSVIDLNATFEMNFFEYYIGSRRHWVTPYMFGGVGMVMFNPKGRYDGNTYELQPLGTEGQGSSAYPDRDPYSKIAMTIPFGIGLKYSVNDYIGLSLSWTMNKTFTDYLDDVSKTYYLDQTGANPGEVTLAGLLSDPTLSHQKDMQRGDATSNDWYSFVGIGLSMKINYGNSQKCLNPYF